MPRLPRWAQAVALGALSLVWFSLGINQTMFTSLDEAKNAQCAREMAQADTWVVPTFNGLLRTDKPPLHYYAMRLGYALWGETETGARFFSAVCAALLVVLVWAVGNTYWGRPAGAWAAAALLLSPHMGVQFRMAVPDPYLILLVTAGTLALVQGRIHQKLLWLYGGYALLGLALLAKGPIALALPAVGIGLTLLLRRELTLAELWRWRPLSGAALALALALPWYLAVHRATQGAFTDGFFFKHNLNRLAEPMEGHGGLPFITPLYVWVGLLPLALVLVPALRHGWRTRRQHLMQDAALCMGAAVVLVFMAAQTRLPNYTVPAYPFWALVIGAYMARPQPTHQAWGLFTRLRGVLAALVAVALPVGSYLGLRATPETAPYAHLAWGLLVVPLGAAIAYYYYRQGLPRRALALWAGGFGLAGLYLFLHAIPQLDGASSVVVLRPHLAAQPHWVAYKRFNPALRFYHPQNIPVLDDTTQLRQALRAKPNLHVLTRTRWQPELQALGFRPLAQQRDLFEQSTTLLMAPPAAP